MSYQSHGEKQTESSITTPHQFSPLVTLNYDRN